MRFTTLLTPLAKRFVAGETADEAVAAAKRVNALGINAIIDFLGEDVNSEAGAIKASAEYIYVLGLLRGQNARVSLSLKLSQMGLLISEDLCVENLAKILAVGAKQKVFVWIDMEGSALTQRTIQVFDKLRSATPLIGLCLQAYLVRTGADLDRLMRRPFSVRLCKGAYKEPPSIALPTKRAVDGNYRMLTHKLFDRIGDRVFPAFATHDPYLIEYVRASAAEKKIDPSQFEFQMLYGIQNRLLQKLALQGYRTSVYIPYGAAWMPYFMRRLRERKENVYFVIKNFVRR